MAEPPLVNPASATGTRGVVLGTRWLARKLVAARPDVSLSGAVYIDLRATKAISSPFIHELLGLWPLVQPLGASREVQATWNLVVEDREEAHRG